jgi:hypothetical protein
LQTKLNNAKEVADAASGKENMRAIFIDAVNRKVEEVQVENELHAFYEKIVCDMIEIIHLGGEHLMVVDEEGCLRNWEVGFRLPKSEGIAGNALVVRDNGDGDFTDSNLPVELFEIAVQFLNLKKHPLPPPACGFAVASDLSAGGDCQSPSGGPERP